MLNMDEINQEIEKLEGKDYTTYDICQKLAILYTIRNNYGGHANSKMPSSKMEIPSIQAPAMK